MANALEASRTLWQPAAWTIWRETVRAHVNNEIGVKCCMAFNTAVTELDMGLQKGLGIQR